jgi:hypothetical protein
MFAFAVGHTWVQFLVNIRKPDEYLCQRAKPSGIAPDKNTLPAFRDF